MAHTANSITTAQALADDLALCRQRGYAINREEWRMGVCGLGAAVHNARGEPVAAVGISVPAMRFGARQTQALAKALLAAAQQADQCLGYQPPAVQAERIAGLHTNQQRRPT